jgi:hypothetical protein
MSGKTDNVVAPKRRRLGDLYMVGKQIELNDESGEPPIVVYMQKISPIEQRDAADCGTKARAAILSIKNSPAEDKILYEDQLEDMGLEAREDFIDFLASNRIEELRLSAEQRIASEDEWSKDDYLNSLQEAWNDGVRDTWITSDDDAEANRIYEELKRYTDEVDKSLETDKQDVYAEYDLIETDELKSKVIDKIIEMEADFAWMNEFSFYQAFYATRDPENYEERYFESVDEVKCLDTRILAELISSYREMTVEGLEGKD